LDHLASLSLARTHTLSHRRRRREGGQRRRRRQRWWWWWWRRQTLFAVRDYQDSLVMLLSDLADLVR